MRYVVTVEMWGEYVRLVYHKSNIRSPPNQDPLGLIKNHYKHPKFFGGVKEDEGEYWERVWLHEQDKADESLRCALVRARSRVRELAFCNPWQYFFTGTLDSTKQDRYNLPDFVKALGVWVGNYNKKYGAKLRYLLVPEQHKDGAYHMHGLLNGVSPLSLVKNKYGYLDMPYYSERFGYMSLSPIKSHEKVCSYVTKYITKDQITTEIGFGKHRYYASRGLCRKTVIAHYWGSDDDEKLRPDFENEWCGLKFMKMSDFVKIASDELGALRVEKIIRGKTDV